MQETYIHAYIYTYICRTGYIRLNMHLHKIGLYDSLVFVTFVKKHETVKHYLLDCLIYQHYQES